VNILHDINVCFIALVYVNYLVFLRRHKHDSPWLGQFSLLAPRRHLWPGHPSPRREREVVGLHEKPALGEVHVQLMLEVAGKDPRRLKPIGFCYILTWEPPTSCRWLLCNLLKMVTTPLQPVWRRRSGK
jgi:hypothetical protein